MVRRIVIVLVLAAGLALVGLFAFDGAFSYGTKETRSHSIPIMRSETPPSEKRYQGASSCSTAGCHNGNDLSRVGGSEYTCWSSRDPHARAYAVLETERSEQMTRRFRRLSNDADVRPYLDEACLACHALNPSPASRGERWTNASMKDGVSCESCHGPSEKWLDLHYQAEWKSAAQERKTDLFETYGFRRTKELTVRIKLCAECHVGGDKAEVNHDLIAAGHPRLMFEYSAYHHLLPRHWEERYAGKDFEARAWEIGQAVCARAALDLLQARATGRHTRSRPELAEFNCYACHHDLQTRSWRQSRDAVDGKIGRPRWGTWYFSAAAVLAEFAKTDSGALSSSRDLFGPLAGLMSKRNPDPEQIASEADRARKKLDEWLSRLSGQSWETERIRRLLLEFAGESADRESQPDWDEAVQIALAIAALHRALGDIDARYRAPHYDDPIGRLTGPVALHSDPARGIRFDSPRGFTPSEFRKALRDVRNAFGD